LKYGSPDTALGVLLSFDGMLRTGELFNLRCGDVAVAPDGKTAVLNLGLTKGGSRRGVKESVIINHPVTLKVLRARLLTSQPGDFLLARRSHHFRTVFKRICEGLGLQDFDFRPYSLRRGGATYDFQINQSMSGVCVRGRWANERTARIYKNEGLSALTQIRLSANSKKLSAKAAAHFTDVLTV
jgi:hypothetical protein